MHIAFIEVANFRKLNCVRIDLHKETTLFVGANNSGKTSAMLALRYFLHKQGGFTINDFTLSHHKRISEIGSAWIENAKLETPGPPRLSDWDEVLPSMDVWIEAKDSDLHYVSHILPTLDWAGGYLGVRLRFEPDDIETFYREFIEANNDALKAKDEAKSSTHGMPLDVKLWPANLVDFLTRRLSKYFKISAYILDPAKLIPPDSGNARLQTLAFDAVPLSGDPFAGLFQIDEIPAQRGFGDTPAGPNGTGTEGSKGEARKLAKQFVDYFSKHLNPHEKPVAADLIALKAIEDAQKAYDARLKISFAGPLLEMEGLGYPGVTDPRVTISTRLRPIDGLDHDAAVQYEVAVQKGAAAVVLPEDYNGLGYQNLISMIFRLMSYRDAWMRVGKAKTSKDGTELGNYPPIHLVLIEEPEAHLHVQVQQVFIRKAYSVLRNHPLLGEAEHFTTQLIVSTHSSHVAHEVDFSCIRYFRRFPAGCPGHKCSAVSVPISTVINLTDAFGDENETSRFVKRYLRATHCDLFFADAAIFIEGSAERILLPHFVSSEFKYLNQCYITWLEIGGSHAHRLQPLIERLGVLTLIITDIDACDPAQHRKASRPTLGKGLKTNNSTLKKWLPKREEIDDLLTLAENDKIISNGLLFAVRVAYQIPINVNRKDQNVSVTPYTFEDAIVLENIATIQELEGSGLLGKFSVLANADSDAEGFAAALFEEIDNKKKTEFALDLLELKTEPTTLRCPRYISEALRWLEIRLKENKSEVLAPAVNTAELIHDALVSVTDAPKDQSISVPDGDSSYAKSPGDGE